MASVNTDKDIISTILGRLEHLSPDQYVLAFGPDGKQFLATPNGYAANYLPSKTLAELAGCDIKRVFWASFGDTPDSWFFAYQFKNGHITIRLGPDVPRTLFDYIEQIKSNSKELLGLLRVQLGNNGSFVAWSKSSWACCNVPEQLCARLCHWSSGTRTHHGMTMGEFNNGPLVDVTWHEDGSYFVRTQYNRVSWNFCNGTTRGAWTSLWNEVGLLGPGVAEIAGLACVAINPYATESDTFAFIKKQRTAVKAPFVLHFDNEAVYARLSPTDGRLQATPPKPEVPFVWAVSTKSGRPHAHKDDWELELKKGQRVRVLQKMGKDWYVVVGKKGIRGWVHGSWLNFDDGRSHEHPKAAWDRFSADVSNMMRLLPVKDFLSMADYVDTCTDDGCMSVKSDSSSLGICAHDLQILLSSCSSYSRSFVKTWRNQWHPDRFAQSCAPQHAERLKAKAAQLFVLVGAVMEMMA